MRPTEQDMERDLVEGCVRNERSSQEQLYRRYFLTMMQMCLRYTSDREEAMTIVNNGFLRVFQKLHTFSFKGSLEGWVRRLVFHALSDYFRKRSKNLHFLVLEDWDSSTEQSGLSQLYLEDLLNLVDQLPPATREVFRLYAIEGYSHVEIGEQLAISEGTSKWHLSNARQKLKEMIYRTSRTKHYAG